MSAEDPRVVSPWIERFLALGEGAGFDIDEEQEGCRVVFDGIPTDLYIGVQRWTLRFILRRVFARGRVPIVYPMDMGFPSLFSAQGPQLEPLLPHRVWTEGPGGDAEGLLRWLERVGFVHPGAPGASLIVREASDGRMLEAWSAQSRWCPLPTPEQALTVATQLAHERFDFVA